LSNELLIKPLEVSLPQVLKSIESDAKKGNWWEMTEGEEDADAEGDDKRGSLWNQPTDWKSGSKVSNQVSAIAKKHHMSNDVKKAVF